VLPTSGQVTEYASDMIHSLGDIDIDDMPYIHKVVSEACYMELSTLHDRSFKVGISEAGVMHYLGDLYQETQGYSINGRVPNYMADRIKTADAQGKPDVEIEPTELPEGIPTNDIGSLIDSIDERVDEVQPDENGEMDLSDGFGPNADVSPQDKGSHIVYNITYNYHNSNNTTNTTDSHNTIDNSINKTVSGTSNNRYNRNKKRIVPRQNMPPMNNGSNNNNNDTSFPNTKDVINQAQPNSATFSTGKSVQEVFDLLRSKEPLLVEEGVKQTAGSLVNSVGVDTGVLPDTNPEPKEDLLTKAQNFDMKMLSKQEIARKAANKAVQTGRAIKQPLERTKEWVQNFVDDLLQRNEDETKAKMLEDNNFRTKIKKVFNLALDFEMFSVAYVLSPYLALLAGVVAGTNYVNKLDMKKDVQNELMTELEVIDDKIKRAKAKNTKDGYDEAYELMRIKRKLLDKATKVTKDPFAKIQPLKKSSGYEWNFD
jgi:hypothetical protein